MTYIGIDPGSNGGIAWITDGNPCVERMPDTIKDLFDLIKSISFSCDGKAKAYLEQVSSGLFGGPPDDGKKPRARMGSKSAFTFGQGFGHLEMALTATRIPFVRIRPQEWQKAMKCMTGGDKNVSKRRAQELFPDIKVTHAKADALLIAEYARISNR